MTTQLPRFTHTHDDAGNLLTVIDATTGLEFTAQPLLGKRLTQRQAVSAAKKCRIGGHKDWALTSRPQLLSIVDLSRHSPAIDTTAFAHPYSAVELQELKGLLQRLFKVRDVLLKVNLAYIASAAQDDRYREAPPFRLGPQQMETLRDVIAVLELRIGVESEAAALAAQRRSPAQLAVMRAALG